MLGIAPGETSFDARVPTIGLAILIRHHPHQFFAAHFCPERAADPAIGAGGDNAAFGRADFDDLLLYQRSGGASLNTGTAGYAFAPKEIVRRQPGRNFRIEPAPLHRQSKCPLHLVTRPDAPRTGNAFRRIKIEIRIGVILLLPQMVCLYIIAYITQTDGACLILQLTIPVGTASQAVERVIGDVELHHALAQHRETRGLRVNDHAGFDRRRAAGRRTFVAVNLDEAEATGTEAFHAVCSTKFGDRRALLCRCTHDAAAGGHGDVAPVNGKRNALRRFRSWCPEIALRLVRHKGFLTTKSWRK